MNLIIGPVLRVLRKRTLRQRFPNGKLSPHFRYIEFFTKDGTPIPIAAIPGIQRMCRVLLEPMRAKFGACFVTSGYRHYAYNKALERSGAVSNSRHVWDRHPTSPACDVTFATGTPEEWGDFARELMQRSNSGNGGVGKYRRMGFVHLDLRDRVDDW